MALSVSTAFGELKINGVSMHTPAWKIHDVVHFWVDSDLRGDYVEIPGQDGEDPVPLRQSSAQINQRFSMVGDVDHTGAPYAASGGYSAWAVGFASNMNYLRTNVLTGRNLTGNRLRAATLQVPGEGSVRTADVHCWIVPGAINNRYIWQATLSVRIPAGMFV